MAYTTIDNPELFFQNKTYAGTGTATSTKAITLDGSENMQPNFVWLKNRTITANHALFDSVRGGTKVLNSNANTGEATEGQMLQSFDSDGFTVGTDSTVNDADSGNLNIIAWNWKESATAGFDIVSYTGNGTSGATVNHGLGVAPNWYMVKRRSDAGSWYMYHSGNTSAPATDFLLLNENYATEDGAQAWNDTEPTSSVFSLGDNENVNANTSTYIAYLWSEVKGFSKFGSYTGNATGNGGGPFVYTGFKPAWIMIKNTNATTDWYLYDNKRGGPVANYYGNNNKFYLKPNSNATEANETFDIYSNGFKIKITNNFLNGDGNTLIYMAFAESPFVNSKGISTTAR